MTTVYFVSHARIAGRYWTPDVQTIATEREQLAAQGEADGLMVEERQLSTEELVALAQQYEPQELMSW
jgi:hypothetical protein